MKFLAHISDYGVTATAWSRFWLGGYASRFIAVLVCCFCGFQQILPSNSRLLADEGPDAELVKKAIIDSSKAFHSLELRGGYVYYYELESGKRWGEGLASDTQIWVQPPGTPTVGMAMLRAFKATGEPQLLQFATEAADALIYGQLKSGGWSNAIDFAPKGRLAGMYRHGKSKGRNVSSLDDGQTQSALMFLIQLDEALGQQRSNIHEAVQYGLDALLAAQFNHGGFPQVWTKAVSNEALAPKHATLPTYDWRTEGRIKNYWDKPTLNDNVCGYVADVLILAHEVYKDDRYLESLHKLGGFLIRVQLPAPQAGWAQQYSDDLIPIWARKFEPPGVSGDETQEVLATLLKITEATSDQRYLTPFPSALSWLRSSQLTDGQVARYYELGTNRPLYMKRDREKYSLTYSDADLPKHYGWKTPSRIEDLVTQLRRVKAGQPLVVRTDLTDLAQKANSAINALDGHSRWLSEFEGKLMVGQPKMKMRASYQSSQVFHDRIRDLAAYLAAIQSSE